MRRSGHKLQVSTFPFLAVLLCAMGALILFLLVMDQRAKIVAKHKAEGAQAARHADRSKEDEARKAEWEMQRDALHQALLAQQHGLQGEADAVHGQLAAAGKKLQEKRADQQTLQTAAALEATRLAQHEKQLKEKKSGLQESAKTEAAAQGDLVRLSAEVADLEKVLADLKALKKRDTQTYSLVPYRGKHGDNRRPLYVECTKDALTFHPDRRVLAGPDFSVTNLRGEVERRAGGLEREENKKGKAEQDLGPPRGPYVLFLIRPDGISSYYQALSYLKGFQIDYGYEVVDQHWALAFAPDDKVASAPPSGKASGTAVTVNNPPVAGQGTPGVAPLLPAVAVGNELPSAAGADTLAPGSAASSGGFSGLGGSGPGDPGLPRLVPFTKLPPPVPLVKAGPGLPFGGVAPGPQPLASAAGLVGKDGQGDGPGSPDQGTVPGSAGQPSSGFAQPGGANAKQPSSPPLGVVLGNRDFVITVACFSDHVTVYPGGKQHWWKGNNAALTDKAFVINVESLIAGRQKSVQPGQPPYRPLIRFQLAADGMGSYLHVYPQLRSLGVPMTRENLDD